LTFYSIGDAAQHKDTITGIFVDYQIIDNDIDHSSMIIYNAEEMNDTSVSRLEDLPVEMLIEIFRYLSVHELYFSFSQLNIRLNSILKSLSNLILVTTSHCDSVFSFFNSFTLVRIQFINSTSSSLSQFNFSKFIGIRSFIIFRSIHSDRYIEPIEQLEQFICPTLCPHLQSLRIPYCSQALADWIFTGAFPYLKICHLYDTSYQRIILPSSTINTLPTLRQLTIQERNEDELEKILLLCPNLSYLDFSCNCALLSFIHIKTPYSSLKRLRLSRLKHFLFHNGRFDFLLSFFPNLTHFDLTVDQCHLYDDDERIDFVQIAQYLQRRLPHLISLEWRIYVTLRNRSSFYRHTFELISKLHPLFKCFGRFDTLIHIASFDFSSIYYYDRHFIRPSSE